MKKLLFAVALLACGTAVANAEEKASNEGKWSTEVMFNPFSNDYSTFKIDQVKVRYALDNKNTLRFGVGFGVNSEKVTPDPDGATEAWGKTNNGFFSINLGYENHFYKNNRVDLYAGAGLMFRHDAASSKQYAKVEGDVYESTTHNYYEEGDDVVRAANTFGVSVFTGIDFYVYKGLYLGAELGINFKYTVNPGMYDENKGGGETVKTDKTNKVTGFSLATACEPALRIGWTF